MDKSNLKTISGGSSIFLDCLRLSAALIVLYIHAKDQWFPAQKQAPNLPGEPSHAAVIAFFVLSGYVIAYTTNTNNRGPIQYAKARLSRLCSMLIPALIITAIISLILRQVDYSLLMSYSRGNSVVRYLLSAIFCNEIWFFSSAPPINIPIWSLSFEFWYYAIFGFWFFKAKGIKAYVLPIIVCLIAGAKILLMMPIWLMGYFAFTIKGLQIDKRVNWILVFILAGLTIGIIMILPPYPGMNRLHFLFYASQFLTDWVIGLFIALTLWLLPSGSKIQSNNITAKVFRQLADLTFPIYILHYPLLVFWRGIFGFKINNPEQMTHAIITVFFVAVIIGIGLEKQRKYWGFFFDRVFALDMFKSNS
ncbi:acyltransferase family protein [Mucilaginibacter jinjuensis]|uniref:Acyltransferase n=1 Tax=Mucilaginibacter jinjuensis TaxID=1176721 RepID=A0ABY7TBY1_9SPHI|nr:acyltransferase [Mucilaginibacter jinjuensis]WCT13833.1 acyltransferase [Mucilaginibacter jinjuensis]